MRSVFAAALIAFMGLASLGLASPKVAYACRPSSDFDPIAESDVIIEGRLVGWEEAGTPGLGPYVPVRIEIDLVKTWKGEATASFIDGASFSKELGSIWDGSGGACGAFNEDPTNAYVILGLDRSEDGTLTSRGPQAFYIGEAPEGPRYEEAVRRLEGLNITNLPATGTGPLTTDNTDERLPLILGGLLLAAAGALVLKGKKTT